MAKDDQKTSQKKTRQDKPLNVPVGNDAVNDNSVTIDRPGMNHKPEATDQVGQGVKPPGLSPHKLVIAQE